MIKVNFNPLRAELEALDKAFYKWLETEEEMSDYEKNELAREFKGPEPLVFSAEDIDEGWGPDSEEGLETINIAMERNMQNRIDFKKRMINVLNEDA